MVEPAFQLTGRVEAVLSASTPGSIVSASVPMIHMICRYGVAGDRHGGKRLVDAREEQMLAFGFPMRTAIAHCREFSAVSAEELGTISAIMELPRPIPFGCLGENLVLSGIPRLTELPPRTMLFFRSESEMRRAVLMVWAENDACGAPGKAILAAFPGLVPTKRFKEAARGRRGVVGIVYATGDVYAGDEVIAQIPEQRIYHG